MRRNGKNKVNKFIGGLILSGALIMSALPVFANSIPYGWSGDASTPGTNIWYNGWQTKETDSSIACWYSGNSYCVGMNIYAAIDGRWDNVTYKGPYYCYNNAPNYTNIKNLAYENNYHSYVSIRPVMTTITSGHHYAQFIPDID